MLFRSPAVQVSTSKASVKIDAGTLQTVEDALKADFFGKPRSDRAVQFLSKILHH